MKLTRSLLVRTGLIAMLAVILFAGSDLASGQSEWLIHSFKRPDATNPYGNLVADGAGNLYGVTSEYGALGHGQVYELLRPVSPATSWTYKVLYAFKGGSDGTYPEAGLVFDAAGNLYGTTPLGGANRKGIVFELSPPATQDGSWTEIVIHTFAGGAHDGAFPTGVVLDRSGNLYGVTSAGGRSNAACGSVTCGVAYELIRPSLPGGVWTESVLHTFDVAHGYSPQAPLILDGKGNLYGEALPGIVYRLIPPATEGGAWGYRVLYDFGDNLFTNTLGGLTFHNNGRLYGTTAIGGGNNLGSVFELVPPAAAGDTWTENTIYSFINGSGVGPSANVIFDSEGNLYGTTRATPTTNGASGTVFELTPPPTEGASWTYTVLHYFPATASDGLYPSSGVTFGKNSVLFGVANVGGAYGQGAVYGVLK